jgi:hypothetical protein
MEQPAIPKDQGNPEMKYNQGNPCNDMGSGNIM